MTSSKATAVARGLKSKSTNRMPYRRFDTTNAFKDDDGFYLCNHCGKRVQHETDDAKLTWKFSGTGAHKKCNRAPWLK